MTSKTKLPPGYTLPLLLKLIKHLIKNAEKKPAEIGSSDVSEDGASAATIAQDKKISLQLKHISSPLFQLLMKLLANNPSARLKLAKELNKNLSHDFELQKVLALLAKYAQTNQSAKEALFYVLSNTQGAANDLALQITKRAGANNLVDEWSKQFNASPTKATAPTLLPFGNSTDPYK